MSAHTLGMPLNANHPVGFPGPFDTFHDAIGGLAGDARYAGVATFDSFATRILAAAEPDGPWTRLDYESRIRSGS